MSTVCVIIVVYGINGNECGISLSTVTKVLHVEIVLWKYIWWHQIYNCLVNRIGYKDGWH